MVSAQFATQSAAYKTQMNNSRGENLVKMYMGDNLGAEMIAVKDHSFQNYSNHTAHISLIDNVMFLVNQTKIVAFSG